MESRLRDLGTIKYLRVPKTYKLSSGCTLDREYEIPFQVLRFSLEKQILMGFHLGHEPGSGGINVG